MNKRFLIVSIKSALSLFCSLSKFGTVFLAFTYTLAARASANEVVNGDFSNNLNGWVAYGSVSVSGAEAVLDENFCGVPCASLYQVVSLSLGNYSLDFDFTGSPGNEVANGYFPDTFFASLYLSTKAVSLDPYNPSTFDTGVGLFDFDRSGITNVISSPPGLISPSGAKVNGWMHLHLDFSLSVAQLLAVTFEFYNDNGYAEDSLFRVDNVAINRQMTEVPEPASAVLLGVGAAALIRRNRRKISC